MAGGFMDKGKKKLIIVISVVLVSLIAIAAIVVAVVKKKNSYRVIKVYEVKGDAYVKRNGIDDLKAYDNMLLESGDTVVLKKGEMTLKLDDDKYVYVEEGTEFILVAEGTKKDSRTKIQLNKGSITNEIDNKLSRDSSYEINTPNSTMAVRGTIFRVSVYEDDNHTVYTRVSVFDGNVATSLVYSDGKVNSDEVNVQKSKEVIIYQDDKNTDYVGDIRDIDYSDLPPEVIELLIEIIDKGTELDISRDELKEYISKYTGDCTVTFVYKGNEFGTQTVRAGECAKKPTLMPAPGGGWDYDFTEPVYKDITINWVE